MNALARAWTWTKQHALALVAGIAVVLGAVVVWTFHRQRVGSLRDQLAVEKARKRVAALDARRKALAEQEGDAAEEIEAIEQQRAEVMREAVERARGVRELSDQELVDAWNDLYRGARR